ncbi:MAG: hypothetical protein WAT79_07005 [Saprospiraceae bacterium]
MILNFSLKSIVLGFVSLLLISSCTDDGTGTDADTKATISFETGSGYITGDTELVINSSFTVNVKATKGTNDMKVLRIKQGSTNVALDRITIGGSPANANPLLLFSGDKAAFNYVITIQSDSILGSKTYSFEVEDENGNIAGKSLIITESGTLVTSLNGVLFNQGGPTGTGGLNLKNGAGVGSMDASAHIKDEGIDLGLPDASNWKQQISGVNGSQLKYIVKGQNGVPESFTFGDITIKEQILGLWSAGTAFTVSNKIKVGDLIIVNNGVDYFLLEVKEVNLTTIDNKDNYKLDIKF